MARKLKLNLQQMLKKQFDPSKSKALENLAYASASKKVKTAQQMLLQEIDEHEVTQSLENGTKSSALGYQANIFEFLGFNRGDKPVEVLRSAYSNFIHLKRVPLKKKVSATKINYDFTVSYPSLTEIYAQTPLPWGGGRSWVRAIEKGGVSNFNFTLANSRFTTSRSGTAIQSKYQVRDFNYKPVPYLSPIINKFRANLGL
ncbi:MAG: hypothetical protein CMD25_04230 [Flavobacteriales bacterium]|nr:hypothetical protein [Flavobacteriales bacterium]|tara:strand:+ start:632 stop:1234 length:603 start_codon:yes stop_codon:yes gene_type:complete